MKQLKTAVKRMVATRWGWKLALLSRRAPGTVVLTYHRVGLPSDVFANLPISTFRAHMLWLKKHCAIIGPDELRESVARPSRTRQSVLITFDDGYRGYHDHVYPVLDELNIPAVVFLTTAFMDDPSRLFWWDMLDLATRETRKQYVRLPWARETAMPLGREGDRLLFFRACKNYLREIPDPQKEPFLAELMTELAVDRRDLHAPRQALSWDEVRTTMGLTRYGGHTHTHPLLSHLNAADLEAEVGTCRNRIRAETGLAPTWFAYPNGRASDFTGEAQTVLRRYGFDTAFTTIEGINGRGTDWMAVRRISGGGSVMEFAWAVSGITASPNESRSAVRRTLVEIPD
jgi:peptidoglycan/xylan/chitin deacetylase (PgdA/CDA1 family)